MGYFKLLLRNPRTIGFGFINGFFSGLGQTHFISLLSPLIIAQYALTNTQYGSLYSLVTLASGFIITFLGPLIDRYDVRYFSLFTGLGLIISQTLLFSQKSLLLVGLGLFGLRLFGQGLCSSLSSISLARYFVVDRGKALALSQLGFPLYEGVITPVAAIILTLISFESFSFILIFSVFFIYMPLCFYLTRQIPRFNNPHFDEQVLTNDQGKIIKEWTRKDVLTDKTIYFIIIQALMPPFALTGLFFHQAQIANFKGWSLPLIASGLIFFAIGRVINTFATGPLVDKISASKLFPFYQIPLSIGFLILAFFNSPLTPAISFSLFGLSVGSGGPIKSSIWAELYGIKHLGAIKSLFATLMVFSTAVSPALFGYILDVNKSVNELLIGLFIINLLAGILAYIGIKKFNK
jgi:MFS family permease